MCRLSLVSKFQCDMQVVKIFLHLSESVILQLQEIDKLPLFCLIPYEIIFFFPQSCTNFAKIFFIWLSKDFKIFILIIASLYCIICCIFSYQGLIFLMQYFFNLLAISPLLSYLIFPLFYLAFFIFQMLKLLKVCIVAMIIAVLTSYLYISISHASTTFSIRCFQCFL